MVASKIVDIPDPPESGDNLAIPEMMFAHGEEPVGVRVLTYQSSRAIHFILNALDEDEVQRIRESAFGKLVEVAEKHAFSGRFIRYLLSRQMKVNKKHEVWFRFAGSPIRFSLREFAIVTGLQCGKYPKKSKLKMKANVNEKPYWATLFGKLEVVTVKSAVKMLRKKTVEDKNIRIKIACLALLSSVLLSTNLKMKILREHAEVIEDIDEFFRFPWGRMAFDMLMSSIKEKDEITLSQNSIALKGFALAIQLVLVESVPSLTEVVVEHCSSSESDSDEYGDVCGVKRGKKLTLSPGHARLVDSKAEVAVKSLIEEDPDRPIDDNNFQWSDEEEDERVDNLVRLIKNHHAFTKDMFTGGATKVDVAMMKEVAKADKKEKRPLKPQTAAPLIDHNFVANIVMQHLRPEVVRLEQTIVSVTSGMKEISCKVGSIEETVKSVIGPMLEAFKGEVLSSVTRVVDEVNMKTTRTNERKLENNTGMGNTPPGEEGGGDVNEDMIRDVLQNISQYSTPLRSIDHCQNAVGASGNGEPDEPSFSLGLTQEGISHTPQCINVAEVGTVPNYSNVVDDIHSTNSDERKAKDAELVCRTKRKGEGVMKETRKETTLHNGRELIEDTGMGNTLRGEEGAGDENEQRIRDVLQNLTEYSTPVRSTHHRQDPDNRSRNQQPASVNSSAAHKQNAVGGHGSGEPEEPSFSLGLSQEGLLNKPQCVSVAEKDTMHIFSNLVDDICMSTTNERNAKDAGLVCRRKSKRARVAPAGLVADYTFGADLQKRSRGAQRDVKLNEDAASIEAKFATLKNKLHESFVINFMGLAVTSKDIADIADRVRPLTAKVVDILVRLIRSNMEKKGRIVSAAPVTFLETRFLTTLARVYPKFKRCKNRNAFSFSQGLAAYLCSSGRSYMHGSCYYVPCSIGKKHWVGLCVNCSERRIIVLDCNPAVCSPKALDSELYFVCVMVPYLVKQVGGPTCNDVLTPFTVERPAGLEINSSLPDSALTAMLLMQSHAIGGVEACKSISPGNIASEAQRVVVMVYEYHEKLQEDNEM